jgi:hypothetical protein
VCGPAHAVILTPDAIYCEGQTEAAAVYRSALWYVSGDRFTSADILAPTTVTFRSATDERRVGPCWGLKIISGYLFDGSLMLARAMAGRWYTYDDEKEYDAIVLQRAEVKSPTNGRSRGPVDFVREPFVE